MHYIISIFLFMYTQHIFHITHTSTYAFMQTQTRALTNAPIHIRSENDRARYIYTLDYNK